MAPRVISLQQGGPLLCRQNKCQPISFVTADNLFWLIYLHLPYFVYWHGIKNYFLAGRGPLLCRQNKSATSKGTWPYPRRNHVWHESLHPWLPAPSGYGHLALKSVYTYICACTHTYIYLPQKQTNQPTPHHHTNTKPQQHNNKKKPPKPSSLYIHYWCIGTQHELPCLSKGLEWNSLFQTSLGRLINCIWVPWWKASNQLCNM